MNRRVLVIGLDGATWAVFDRCFELGYMPNLQRLVTAGARAIMTSTRPISTPVAWTTMVTGTNPGKHGVQGFKAVASVDRPIWDMVPANGAAVREPAVWKLMGEKGRRTTVVNVPITYPPAAINGFLISGMDTPQRDSEFTYPESLKQELVDAGIDYQIDYDTALDEGASDASAAKERLAGAGDWFFERARLVTEQRCRTMELLLKRPWDFFMGVFVGPDRLMHIYWDYLFRESLPDEPYAESIHQRTIAFWKELDQAVARIASHADDNTTVVFVSDHGFARCCGEFYVNQWLKEHGWLHTRRPTAIKRLAGVAKKMGLSPYRMVARTVGTTNATKLALSRSTIDWKRTRAYFRGDSQISINVRGREYDGCVAAGREHQELRARLRDELLNMTDQAGRKVLSNVYFREELYHGPCVPFAGDLVLEPGGGQDESRYTFYSAGMHPPGTPSPTEFMHRGTHHPDGIFAVTGAGIAPSPELHRVNILDFAPTAMHLAGLPVPEHFDGQVALAMIGQSDEMRVSTADYGSGVAAPAEAYSDAEAREVEERLRGLGYLD